MSNFFKILGIIFLGISATFYRLFVITKIWAIIAVGMFGLSAIGMYKAFALCILVQVLSSDYESKNTTALKLHEVTKKIVHHALAITISWGIVALFFG